MSALLKIEVQSEAEVLRDVRPYIALHPKVCRLIRINSGGAQIGDSASTRFVRFNDIEGQAQFRYAARRSAAHARAVDDLVELLPDFMGFLWDGRVLAVEVKGGDWKGKPRNARERGQERFLNVVRQTGGVAGFVCSLRAAEELLRGA